MHPEAESIVEDKVILHLVGDDEVRKRKKELLTKTLVTVRMSNEALLQLFTCGIEFPWVI